MLQARYFGSNSILLMHLKVLFGPSINSIWKGKESVIICQLNGPTVIQNLVNSWFCILDEKKSIREGYCLIWYYTVSQMLWFLKRNFSKIIIINAWIIPIWKRSSNFQCDWTLAGDKLGGAAEQCYEGFWLKNETIFIKISKLSVFGYQIVIKKNQNVINDLLLIQVRGSLRCHMILHLTLRWPKIRAIQFLFDFGSKYQSRVKTPR